MQLTKDFAMANKPAKKAPCKKLISTAKTANNAALIVPIRQKLLPTLRLATRKPASKVLIVLLKQVGSTGVAVAKIASCLINLL